MVDCNKCFHLPVCGKLIYCQENGVVVCNEYNDRTNLVEVVRCKDCIHWYEQEGVCLKIYSDGAVSPYAWQDRNPDDFCSYGKVKDND